MQNRPFRPERAREFSDPSGKKGPRQVQQQEVRVVIGQTLPRGGGRTRQRALLTPNLKLGHYLINKLRKVLSRYGCRISHCPGARSNDIRTADGDSRTRKEGSPILFHIYFRRLEV